MTQCTTAELAKTAGVARSRCYQWAEEGMPGFIRRNTWDSEVALAWIAERREDSPVLLARTEGVNDLRARLYRLQGDAQELRNGLLASSLVLRETAHRAYAAAIAEQIEAGDRFVALGRTAQAQADRRALWHELRDLLAGSVESVAGDLARGEDVAAAGARIRR